MQTIILLYLRTEKHIIISNFPMQIHQHFDSYWVNIYTLPSTLYSRVCIERNFKHSAYSLWNIKT